MSIEQYNVTQIQPDMIGGNCVEVWIPKDVPQDRELINVGLTIGGKRVWLNLENLNELADTLSQTMKLLRDGVYEKSCTDKADTEKESESE